MSAFITNPVVRSIMRGLLVWAPLWISTTVLFGVAGLFYVVLIKESTYLASQALLVRDEATGAVMRLGRFQSQAEMKAAQETILEMAKSQQVVEDTLIAIGPPSESSFWPSWSEYPSKDLVERVSKTVSVHAPKGTEFGVTEVIYVDVTANSQDKALRMSSSLSDALEARLQQIRKARADGVLAELTLARDSAKQELGKSTSKLHDLENAAGSDLSDLRGMTESVAGASTARAELDQSKNELRQAEINLQSLFADREMLIRATMDPSSFIVAPGTVLTSQPGLKRLREGLVDAQIAGSHLTGRFTESHPSVIASKSSQSSIVNRFLQELKASIAGVESDISLVEGRIKRLETQKSALQDRLASLADSRAPYANLLSEVKSKVSILEAAERDLAEVQAARDSSISTSLLTRLDAPTVSDRPIGPGRTTIVGLCTMAGLVFGLGIVFVMTPLDAGPSFGRRTHDRQRGRRDADLADVIPSVPSSASAPIEASSQAANFAECLPEKPPTESSLPDELRLPNGYRPRSFKTKEPLSAPISVPPKTGLAGPESTNVKTLPDKTQTRSTASIESSSASTLNAMDLDQTFKELSKLQSQKPASRSEELSLQMKMQELKDFLSFSGMSTEVDSKNPEREDPLQRTKPRQTRQN